VFVSVFSTFFAIVFGTLSGYALSRYRFRARTFLGNVLYFSQLLPHMVLLVPIFILYTRTGLSNSLMGLIYLNVFFMVPISTWLLKGFFDSTPVEIEEAARLDGCSRLRTIFSIAVPMNVPGIFATSLFVLMDTWYEWLFASTLIDDPRRWTVSASIFVFIGELGIDWKQMMAAGVMATIPTLFLFALLQKSMISGVRLGRY
jgi:ABC-type glycerol-3-phosphate transport system permease component